MQELNKNSVLLKRLEPNDIELVREWRNTAAIAEQMEFKEIISAEQQKKWFNKINNSKSAFYFMIFYLDQPIGLIHLNEIDLEDGTAFAGLFIGNQKYIGTGLALSASLQLIEFAFNQLGLTKIFAKVKNVNKSAIEYNQLLGFERIYKHNQDFDVYLLKQADFKIKQEFLERLLTST